MIGYGSCDWNLFRVNDSSGEVVHVGPAAEDNRRLEPRNERGQIGKIYRQEKEGGLWGWKISADREAVYPEINAVVGTDGGIFFVHETEIAVDYPLITDQVDRNGETYSTLGAGQSKQRLLIPLDNDIFDALLVECHAVTLPSWAIAFEGADELLDFIVETEMRRRGFAEITLSEAMVKQYITTWETNLVVLLWLRGVSQILYGYRGETAIPLLKGKFEHVGAGVLGLK